MYAGRCSPGTLYPILIRLADRGLIEASWEEEQPVGRPRRHRYRLTAAGMKQAQQAPAPRTRRARTETVGGPLPQAGR